MAIGAVACGDDVNETTTTPPPGGSSSGSSGTSGTLPDGGSDLPPAYIVAKRVWAQDDAFQYVKVTSTLDFDFSPEETATAREIGGYAGITVHDGFVYVGDQETPFVTKYRVTADNKLEQVGERLNFTDYFQDSIDGLNSYYQAKAGDDQYFFYGADGRTGRVHWKAGEFKIAGSYTDTAIPAPPANWTLRNMGNRTQVEGFKDAIVWPFSHAPNDGFTGTPVSYLAVYDRATGAEKAVLKPNCPELAQATMDEEGNLYFATTYRSPVYGMYNQETPACAVKVKPDGTLDATFGEKAIHTMTGGKYGVNFRYLGNGKAAANVVDATKLVGANFNGPIQEDVQCQIEECEGDKASLHNPAVWESHLIDLATNTSKVMNGYVAGDEVGGSYRIYFKVDGRTFFMGYNATGNVVYEVNLDTGAVSRVGQSAHAAGTDGEYTVISRVR